MTPPVAAARPLDKPFAVQHQSLAGDAEAGLVFQLARAGAVSEPLDLRSIENWPRVLQLASDENAIIALRDCLRSMSDSAIPLSVERYLAILALDREFRMRQLRDRLEQTLIALNDAGIEVLLLKGGALACTVYGSFAARPMRDIDILVRPHRAEEARALMLELEWESDPDVPGDRSYGTHHHLPPLRDVRTSGLRLEIHRAILPPGHPFRCTEDEIWRRARGVTLGAGHALVMQADHHAVHLAIHFAWSHMLRWGAWHAFRDLGALGASKAFDWDAFVDTALRWGASSSCYWTLRLGAALSTLSVSREVLSRLEPRFATTLAKPLMRHFVNGLARGDACPSVRLNQALWTMAMQPRREGHGRIRPWTVSEDLLFAADERAEAAGKAPASRFAQMSRSGRYLTEIIA